jgi:hypothetical protein
MMPRRAKKTKRARGRRPQPPEERSLGRPTKYSEGITGRICKFIGEGCSRETAAALVGVNVETLYAWARQFPEFSDQIKKADAKFEETCIRAIRKAGRDTESWTASAWLLERKFPDRWGKVDRHLIRMQRLESAEPLPEQFIRAINKALGVHDTLTPIGRPDAAGLLPSGNGHGDSAIDADFEELPVLPQD